MSNELSEYISGIEKENAELKSKVEELETKLSWMTKKRWALEMALADISCMNKCYISSTADETIRTTHGKFEKVIDSAIEWAGGITIYVEFGKNDFTSEMPCYVRNESANQSGKWPDAVELKREDLFRSEESKETPKGPSIVDNMIWNILLKDKKGD